jgi:hypothetical protein
MADNTTLNPGTGGDIIRAEEKSGSKTQVMLLDIGGVGAESLVDGSNPLPVTVGNFPGTQAVSGPLTDAQLRATDLHVVPANITGKFREAFETLNTTPTTGKWTLSAGTGDIVQVDGNALAASYLTISKSPWNAANETWLETQAAFTMPIELAFGAHLSQRTLGQEFAFEVVDTGTPLPDISDLAISSIAQTTTTLTVTTTQPHGLSPGKSTGIRGVLDSRVNYPALVVASTPSPTQFTATAGPGGNLPSLSAYTASVLASTTAALPANVYANGTLGVGATLTASANGAFPDQDGVAIPLNGRVLVRFEAAGANNGVYFLSQVGSAGTPWILTRATDYDTVAELTVVAGALFAVSVFVSGGLTHSQKEFYLSATVTTVGTTAVTWVDSGSTGPLGFVFFRERLGRANNGAAQIFENATVTNASLYIRSESGDALPSGVALGNHAITVGTTASVQLANAAYTYAFAPTTEYRINVQADRTQWFDSAVDAVAQTANRLLRTQVCPDPDDTYKLRIRATNNKSLTVLTAKVTSVSKTTTVGTFTTATAHGLVTGDLIVYYGNSNTGAAAFPNLTAATAVTVIDATSFTATIGTSSAVTGYGGVIAKVQGGNLLSALGAITQTAINATLSTLSDGTRQLVLTGSGNWAGLLIGDYVELAGAGNNTNGATLGVDGAWKVANIATTALTLVPTTAAFAATLPADFGTTTCGGAVIKRTDLRVSFVRLFDYERERVELLARPSGDLSAAAPVALQGGTTAVTGTVGITAGALTNFQLATSVADVASAAITTTATVAAITPALGISYQVNIPVTVVSGTNPTMDVRIEESDDGGTNWFTVHDFPRITAVGIYRSPLIPVNGNRVRYVQTIAGTTPSFTRAINRLQSNYPALPVRQLIDRTIAPNTGNSVTPVLLTRDCGNSTQLVVNMGAITTTAPQFQLEGSDDFGATWYAIGAPLTGVASSTVQQTVNSINAAAIRVRVSTAGSGATLGYVMMKAHD